MKLLVTGCSGFIGTNFVRFVLRKRSNWKLCNLDLLTYAGQGNNLADLQNDVRYSFVQGDIVDPSCLEKVESALGGRPDAIVNFAAESHVDNSIKNPGIFVRTNVQGTLTLLDYARLHSLRFLQVSTDEVYGSLGETGLFTEETPLAPNSPYSASKAGADLLVRSFHETFALDAVITRCSNNYGPYQFPEKLIPLAVTHLIRGRKVPVYGKGLNVRDWLHVDDHCSGILIALEKGTAGRVYNIGGNNEWRNIDIVHRILEIMGLDESHMEFVTDRLGHDMRYAIDATRISQELGWEPVYTFITGLPETVQWYRDNETWWAPLKK